MKTWNIEEVNGYKPQYTFYEDFSIADAFGKSAILDTFKRAFGEWKGNYKALTELCLALNWKIWEHWQSNKRIAELYNSLWEKTDEYAVRSLKGEHLEYFYSVAD